MPDHDNRRVQLNFRLDPGLHRQLVRAAAADGRSVAGFVRNAIVRALPAHLRSEV
jgi:predicted HicB family RNase H-like nuclease